MLQLISLETEQEKCFFFRQLFVYTVVQLKVIALRIDSDLSLLFLFSLLHLYWGKTKACFTTFKATRRQIDSQKRKLIYIYIYILYIKSGYLRSKRTKNSWLYSKCSPWKRSSVTCRVWQRDNNKRKAAHRVQTMIKVYSDTKIERRKGEKSRHPQFHRFFLSSNPSGFFNATEYKLHAVHKQTNEWRRENKKKKTQRPLTRWNKNK